MTRIIIAALVAIVAFPSSGYAAPLDKGVVSCISGLKAAENFVRDNRPKLNPEYFQALYGWEAFNADPALDEQIADVQPSTMFDIKHCSNHHINGADINVLMGHVYGFAPDNPEEELARCYSSFLGMGEVLENSFGQKKAGEVAMKVGHRVGQMMGMLNALYKNITTSSEILQKRAVHILKPIFQLPATERYPTLRKYAASCRWYDIPLMPLLNGLEIGASAEEQQ